MSKHRTRPWIVAPHDPIEKLDDNVWAVQGSVPGLPHKRRMTIVKRADGTLLFYHAVPLRDDALAEVLAWGKPAYLVIAHDSHGIDAQPFRDRLGLKLFGPKSQVAKMRAKFDTDGALEDIPPDPAVTVEEVAGTKSDEPIVIARSGNGARTSLAFCDAFQNNDPAVTPWILRMIGFTGPKVPPVFKLFFMRDKEALRAEFQTWAAIPGLARLIPCHGPIVHSDAAGTLRRAAQAL